MFIISLPSTFKVGDSTTIRVGGKPAMVTWRDQVTLVIEPDDLRPIRFVKQEGGLRHFFCGDRGGPGLDRTAVVQHLHVGLSDAELVGMMRQARRCRERGAPSVTCAISGYDEDPRELGDIPEVRAFCKRLVGLGYVAFLDVATSIRELPGFCLGLTLGAWEVWSMARNELQSGRYPLPGVVVREFKDKQLPYLKAVANDHLTRS
jgi:hypothetical protein